MVKENHFKQETENVKHAIVKLLLCLGQLEENDILSSSLKDLYHKFLIDALDNYNLVLKICNDGLQELEK